MTAARDISVAAPVAASTPRPRTTRTLALVWGAVACVAVIAVAGLFWREQNQTDRPVATPAQAPESTAVPPVAPAAAASATTAGPPPAQAPRARPEPAPPVAAQPRTRSAPTLPAEVPTPASSTQADGAARTPAPPVIVAAPPNLPLAALPAPEDVKAQAPPATAPNASPAAPVQTATPPPRAAAAPEPARLPTPAPVETDDAAIRRVIRTFEQAIETKDIGLYRSVRPGLSAASEAVVRSSFKQVDSQQIDIRIESIRIDGRTATAQLARRDTLVTAGRSQVQNSTQTMRFQKTDAGWIIAE